MKTNISIKQIAAVSAILLTGGLASCTDWYDHYEGDVQTAEQAKSDAWTLISTNAELSEFASVLRAQGYDKVLSGNETYTIWAPSNGAFKAADVQDMTSDLIVKHFIQNHIARNSYPASGSLEQKLFMMNKKSNLFAGNGSYTINNIPVKSSNIATKNGVLHIIDGQIPYFENIYETFNSDDPSISEVAAWYKKYDMRVLDLNKSIPGDIVNGEQEYLDSVFNESNALFNAYAQYLNEEDSNYTMIIPKNEAWNKSKEALQSVFKYPKTYNVIRDIPERERSTTDAQMKDILAGTRQIYKDDPAKVMVKVEVQDIDSLMADSMVNRALCRTLCFNNNYIYNKGFNNYETGCEFEADSIVSTTGVKLYADDARMLMDGLTKIKKSNGSVLMCEDELRIPSWSYAYAPMVCAEAEYNVQASFAAQSPSPERVTEANINPEIKEKFDAKTMNYRFYNGRYIQVAPDISNGNPSFVLGIDGRAGTTYNIYATFLPNNITNTREEPKANYFRAWIGYTDADGKLVETQLKGETGKMSYLVTTPGEVCEVCLGTITLPVVPAMPYIRFLGFVNNNNQNMYDRTFRIDNILLIPQELDEYMKANPDYKFQYETY